MFSLGNLLPLAWLGQAAVPCWQKKKPVAQQVAIVLKTNILIPSTKMMSGDVDTLRLMVTVVLSCCVNWVRFVSCPELH